MRTFLDHFQEMVGLFTDQPALIQGEVELTYGQLDRRSNAVARALVDAGVGPSVLVALLMDRSPDVLVALLGILKAGAAYVPLDPDLPAERLAYMLDDCRPALVLTRASLSSLVPAGIGRMCIDLDPALGGESADPPGIDVHPESPAYVLYTSGSTGAPKGVEIAHASLANLIASFAAAPGLSHADRVLAHVTLSFDISVIELLLSLTAGARIVLAPAPENRDARALADLIAAHRITFVGGTPSFFRLLRGAGWRDGHGMTVFCGGEPLSRELADDLLRTGATVWNIYGATEATVWSTQWKVEPRGPIVIGDPIRNTDLYILDAARQPVPVGAIGEMCIGGAGVGRGYLHRPSLTAERFVSHPLAAGRIYRTGDEARRRPDGGIEVLGRIDRQMKIDGFRIEPGEIEEVLSDHEGVQHAVVRAMERSPDDQRLVAYIIHGASPPPREEDLRALARRKLPAHMIPASFVFLPDAPRTPNGKLDWNALPPPDWRRAGRAGGGHQPRTPLERHLSSMWRDILGLDEVGIDESFFDVGGRSRLGATLFARIERDLGARLPLATLFESPTIERLAQAIERAGRAAPSWETLVPIRPSGWRRPLFFIHPVGGNVLIYRNLIRHIDPGVPCYGLQALGLDGVQAPLTSVEAMAERYLRDVRASQSRGPYRLCGFSFGGLVAFEMARRLRESGETIELLALLDTEFPVCPSGSLSAALARSSTFRRYVHPTLQRARRHVESLRRLGIAGYLRARRRSGAAGMASTAARLEVVHDANLRAALGYLPPRYTGTLTYFHASDAAPSADRRALWSRVAPAIDVVFVPGGHSDLREEPQAGAIGREITYRLRGDA